MKEEKISIVVPIYNVEKYLNRCIDSIVNQTYNNLEIILVDDGSTDNCGRICDAYKKKDNRIKVIHKKNGGLSEARNYGIRTATGKYIGFVDSDDFISKEMYEKLYLLLIKNNADISVVGYRYFYENETIFDVKLKDYTVNILKTEEAMKYLFNYKFGNFAWNKLYKLSLFENIEFPVGKKMEDLGTTYKLFNKCRKIVYSDMKLYYYLQREDSILHSTDIKLCNDQFELSYERFLFLKENYPKIIENYTYMFDNALRYYPFLYNKNKVNAEQVLSQKIIYKNFSLGMFIRFIMYKFNKKLYSNIFRLRGIKK